MTAERAALAERVREALPDGRPVREIPMFGGLSFMVDDAMVVAAGRDGGLLVRIDPARRDDLLEVPGAEPAAMGPDRTMGPSWLYVSPAGLATDDQLAFWIQAGLEHRTARTPSKPRSPRR